MRRLFRAPLVYHSNRATICPFRCPLTVVASIRPKPEVGTPAPFRVAVCNGLPDDGMGMTTRLSTLKNSARIAQQTAPGPVRGGHADQLVLRDTRHFVIETQDEHEGLGTAHQRLLVVPVEHIVDAASGCQLLGPREGGGEIQTVGIGFAG